MYICLNGATVGRAGLSLEQFAQIAADAGYPGADVDPGYAVEHGTSKLRDLFASKNLRFGGWGLPDWRVAEITKLNDEIAQFEKRARAARQLDIDSCATWIMPSSDRPFMDNWNFHVARLRPLAKVLADNGLRLGLEFIGPYHLRRQHPHEFIFSPGLMLELAAAVGPNVGLLVDSFHVHTSGTTFEHLAQIPGDRIVLGHINDCPKVPVQQAIDSQRLIPGEGAIDLPGFIAAMGKAGYRGPLSLEIFNAELTKLGPAEAARRSAAGTRSALGGLEFG